MLPTTSLIDVTFDFRSDTPPGRDPDAQSPTLRKYHQILWSKELPCGTRFELSIDTPKVYLCHRSTLGEFFLSSDSVIPTFRGERRIANIMAELPESEVATFDTVTYTMGGMMIFPAKRVDRRNTINGARGFHPQIKDRFDLTVECIRRHYLGEDSPLAECLGRYRDFFKLFISFNDYINFFLLQDLVSPDYSAVKFMAPFDGFDSSSPVPGTLDAYRAYCKLANDFVTARNRRIQEWCTMNLYSATSLTDSAACQQGNAAKAASRLN